jgi:dolichyl-phosphate-mannose-protein mannosyltransferase
MRNVIAFAIIITFLTQAALSGADQNLVQNPSFEETVNGNPSIWSEVTWVNDPGITSFGIDTAKPHSGKSSGFIVNKKENHARFVQVITVSENSMYKFSAWIRTENVGDALLGAGIGITDKLEFGGDIRKTSDGWKQAEIYVKTGAGINFISIMLSLGTYGALNTGKAWFDDISIVETDTIPSGAIVCTVDAESGKNNLQNAKVEPAKEPRNDSSKIRNGLFLFIIIGIIILIGGACYLVIFITLKKKKPTTGDSSSPEPTAKEEEKKE